MNSQPTSSASLHQNLQARNSSNISTNLLDMYCNIKRSTITNQSKDNFQTEFILKLHNCENTNTCISLISNLITVRFLLSNNESKDQINTYLNNIKNDCEILEIDYITAFKFIKNQQIIHKDLPNHLKELTNLVSKEHMLNLDDNIINWLSTKGCDMRTQYKFITMQYLNENLTPTAKDFFQSFLHIPKIGDINATSPIVAGDLDGSHVRTLLLAMHAKIVSFANEESRQALTEILNEEAKRVWYEDNQFTLTEYMKELIDSTSDLN